MISTIAAFVVSGVWLFGYFLGRKFGIASEKLSAEVLAMERALDGKGAVGLTVTLLTPQQSCPACQHNNPHHPIQRTSCRGRLGKHTCVASIHNHAKCPMCSAEWLEKHPNG